MGTMATRISTADGIVELTCSLDTNAYADGDVLFDTQELANAARVTGSVVILQSVVVLDKDDQKKALKFVFMRAATSLGTENSAPDITDAEAEDVLGIVAVADTDYVDLGACSVATVKGIGLVLQAAAGETSLYVAGMSGGTGTYTAAGLIIKFGFLRS